MKIKVQVVIPVQGLQEHIIESDNICGLKEDVEGWTTIEMYNDVNLYTPETIKQLTTRLGWNS